MTGYDLSGQELQDGIDGSPDYHNCIARVLVRGSWQCCCVFDQHVVELTSIPWRKYKFSSVHECRPPRTIAKNLKNFKISQNKPFSKFQKLTVRIGGHDTRGHHVVIDVHRTFDDLRTSITKRSRGFGGVGRIDPTLRRVIKTPTKIMTHKL